MTRCAWVGDDPLFVAYHDTEWGVPVHDDRLLFEFLVLEGAQAGLSWSTILRKREGYRRAFSGFDPAQVAAYGPDEVGRLLADSSIVRNRLKIESAIGNARAFVDVQREFGSFDAYVWRFVDGETIQNAWRTLAQIPAKTPKRAAEPRSQGARLRVRRADHLLRAHAGYRHGQRPHGRLFPLGRAEEPKLGGLR